MCILLQHSLPSDLLTTRLLYMVNTNFGRTNLVQDFIEQVKSLEQKKVSADLTVSNEYRQGVIHVRDGVIVSAHTGVLHGNGAVLTLALITRPHIVTTPASDTVQKTVFISIGQLERFLAAQKKQPASDTLCDEEKNLHEAITLFFRFQYKQAVEKLVYILRHNRFYYPAWLWQSRILTRQDYISKALDEAYRWGNHDQDIWREARKIRPQITEGGAPVRRCIFCWSILKTNTLCDHCHAYLTITGRPLSDKIKCDEIKFSLNHFSKAFQKDKTNARIAFTLALGNFNLKEYQRALIYLRLATKLAPETPLYDKSLTLLLALAKSQTPSPQESTPAKETVEKTKPASILIIEDSMTSRKVLSMLFSRIGYRLIEAASGIEAVQAVRNNNPDLVLLDVMLPDTNGHDLLVKLRTFSHLRDTPVIMLTGKHDAKDRMKGIQGGVNEYITKPFNPQKLTTMVEGYLRSKHSSVVKPVSTVTTDKISPISPATPLPQASRQQSSDPRTSLVNPKAQKGEKSIFIIEDSSTSMKVLTMILGRNGYHTYKAFSGKEALDIAPDIYPDLIVLDVMLPDMTGYQVLPELKKIDHFSELPVIMLTGKREAKDRMQGMLAGTNEYLTKPFDPKKLLSIINGYI